MKRAIFIGDESDCVIRGTRAIGIAHECDVAAVIYPRAAVKVREVAGRAAESRNLLFVSSDCVQPAVSFRQNSSLRLIVVYAAESQQRDLPGIINPRARLIWVVAGSRTRNQERPTNWAS